MNPQPIAITVSDVHFSPKPPSARSAEPDWFEAMDRPWRQIKKLQKEYSDSALDPIPILIPGDIFHHWNMPPELISFVMGVLPERVYAIAGNHDLYGHNYSELKKSAYFTLMKAGKITNLELGKPLELTEGLPIPLRLRGYAYPFNDEINHCPEANQSAALCIEVALVHRYCWLPERGDHPQAKPEDRAERLQKSMKGFDVVLFGDNHIPFRLKGSPGDAYNLPTLINCGCLIPRRSMEKDITPSAWLIYSDGSTGRVKLDCSADKWLDLQTIPEFATETMADFDNDFIDALGEMRDAAEKFITAVHRFMDNNKIPPAIRKLVLGATEKKKKA